MPVSGPLRKKVGEQIARNLGEKTITRLGRGGRWHLLRQGFLARGESVQDLGER